MQARSVHTSFKYFTTFIFSLAFMASTFIAASNFLNPQLGTSLEVMETARFPQITLCPMRYKEQKVDLVASSTNLSFEQALKLIPSVPKNIIHLVQASTKYEYAGQGDYGSWIYDPNDQATLFKESSMVSPMDLNLVKCSTIQLPQMPGFGMEGSMVMIYLNVSLVDFLILEFHEVNQSTILHKLNYESAMMLDTSSGSSVFFLDMKGWRNAENCSQAKIQMFPCVQSFIAAKMNCSTPWELNENATRPCESKEDLQGYIDLRLSVHTGKLDHELKSCIQKSCERHSWQAKKATGFSGETKDKMVNQLTNNSLTKEQTANMAVVGFAIVSPNVEVIQQFYLYGLSNLIADIGGNMGLFLGASLLTFAHFFIDFLFSLINQKL